MTGIREFNRTQYLLPIKRLASRYSIREVADKLEISYDKVVYYVKRYNIRVVRKGYKKEEQIKELIKRGCSLKEIARRSNIPYTTVHSYISKSEKLKKILFFYQNINFDLEQLVDRMSLEQLEEVCEQEKREELRRRIEGGSYNEIGGEMEKSGEWVRKLHSRYG